MYIIVFRQLKIWSERVKIEGKELWFYTSCIVFRKLFFTWGHTHTHTIMQSHTDIYLKVYFSEHVKGSCSVICIWHWERHEGVPLPCAEVCISVRLIIPDDHWCDGSLSLFFFFNTFTPKFICPLTPVKYQLYRRNPHINWVTIFEKLFKKNYQPESLHVFSKNLQEHVNWHAGVYRHFCEKIM